MNCSHCNDTGSLQKHLDGYLDCGHCEIAEQRRTLDDWLRLQRRTTSMLYVNNSDAWLICQHGIEMAKEAV